VSADSNLAADAAARRLARERFDVPVLLEAGAGTGKTRALIERLLAWTLDAGWNETKERLASRAAAAGRPRPDARTIAAETLDGIVAITFTDSAAAEMASRLGAALAAVARGEAANEEISVSPRLGATALRERAAALAGQLARARIQTIHAFCRSLLAQFPFEAGLHPAFDIDSDQAQLERIATETLAARLSAALAAGDTDWIELLGDGATPEEILEAVVLAVADGVTPEALEADPFPPERVAELLRRSRNELAPLAASLAAVAGQLKASSLAARVLPPLESIVDALREGAHPLSALSDEVEILVSDFGRTIRAWAQGKSIATIEKKLPPGSEAFAPTAERALRGLEALRELHPEALARSRRVVAPVVREVRERMRRAGWVLFEDLLTRAARLLEERADIRAAVRRGIRQLLVDEFQDTDRRQCEIVARLALDERVGDLPGLFVVGDPKQSIYGWRSADLAAYEDFLALARKRGAEEGRLAMNFRSLPAILDEVERLLEPALRPEPGLQPPFERLLPSPAREEEGRSHSGRAAVEHWVSIDGEKRKRTTSGAATRIEARAVAADLLARRRADPELRWSQVALLSRTGTDIEVYLDALREAGIAFAVEKDRSYWRRREIIDVAALVRAAVDPGDHVALVTLLRAPFVGVPDAALLGLWHAGFPAHVDALLAPDREKLVELREMLDGVARGMPDGVPGLDHVAGWEASAFAALEALAELRHALGREPAERFVERLRARFALEATAAARYLGRFGVANLERFFRELEAFLESAGDDPAALVRFLRRAIAEQRDAQEARPAESDDDAVRVMTIHRAKGLQFSHVYLLQTHKGRGGSDRDKPFAAERLPDGALAYRLFGGRSLDWSRATERRAMIADREEARLLYVALTRAADRLVVLGQRFSARGDSSFLGYLKERLAGSPAEALESATGAFQPALDAHGALWRAPALEEGWSLERWTRATEEPFAPNDPVEIQRDLELLNARRLKADARASRPRFATASSLAVHGDEAVSESEEGAGDAAGQQPRPSVAGDRGTAFVKARGVAIHKALELQVLADDDLEQWHQLVDAAFLAEMPDADDGEIAAIAAGARGLRRSLLWKQLSLLAIRQCVVARELPLLIASEPGAESGPTDGYVGTLDLLYRDSESEEWVVADFKTDAITDEAEAVAKVEQYRPQLSLYGRAVQSALELEAPPRLELWLLAVDRVVEIPPPVPGSE